MVVRFAMASRFTLLFCVGFGVLTMGVSSAAPRSAPHRTRRYVLRDLRIEGNATDDEKKLLHERIWSTIELIVSEGRDELAHEEDVTAALAEHPDLKGCNDARCGAALGELIKADKVLSIAIERSGVAGKGDWMVRVWHLDVRALKVGAPIELPCRACGAEDLLGDLSHSLSPALQIETGVMCTVKVTSRPPGATVSMEGTIIGETPFQHTLLPGRHAVAVEKQGFSRGEDDLDCPPGSMQNMAFALTAGGGAVVHQEAPPPAPEHRSPALKAVGATLVVLGVAGIAAGAAELYLDGRGSCSLATGQKECPSVYDTKTIGGALVGVGAAGLVGGVITLVVDAMRGKPAASGAHVSADVRVGPSQASMGVKGSF